MEELYRLVNEIKSKPMPSRIVAGARMYVFIRDSLAPAGLAFPALLAGIPLLLSDDMPAEWAHVYDQNDNMMHSFIWKEGEDGVKILMFRHALPEFYYDFQRISPNTTPGPGVRGGMEPDAASATNSPYDSHSTDGSRLEPSGYGTQDGREPGQDQAG